MTIFTLRTTVLKHELFKQKQSRARSDADKNPYEPNRCQRVTFIINFILIIVFLMCFVCSTLIDATRRLIIFGGG